MTIIMEKNYSNSTIFYFRKAVICIKCVKKYKMIVFLVLLINVHLNFFISFLSPSSYNPNFRWTEFKFKLLNKNKKKSGKKMNLKDVKTYKKSS